MTMSNLVALEINVGDVDLTETDHPTSFITAIFFARVSDILLLSTVAMCGLMETLGSRWTYYFSPAVFGREAEMLPRSTLGSIIGALIAFVEIKSQGQPEFPFQTHPRVAMVSVNSLIIYGLASTAEHVFSSSEQVCWGSGTVVDL